MTEGIPAPAACRICCWCRGVIMPGWARAGPPPNTGVLVRAWSLALLRCGAGVLAARRFSLVARGRAYGFLSTL